MYNFKYYIYCKNRQDKPSDLINIADISLNERFICIRWANFHKGKRNFSSIYEYMIKIEGNKCVLVYPLENKKTHHKLNWFKITNNYTPIVYFCSQLKIDI